MELAKISKGDWTFILTASGRWEIIWKGKHLTYASSDDAMRALAAIDDPEN